MSRIITIRLPAELAEWLSKLSRETGVPVSRIVREHMQRFKTENDARPYLRLAGKFKGAPDLSTRKGFSR